MHPVASLVIVALVGCGRSGFDVVGVSGDAVDGTGSDAASGDGRPATSCVSLPSKCGPGGTGCCESPVVVGGTFYRGYDMAADMAYPDMTRPATVSSFRLDKYEVTVGRFRQFVAAGRGTQANPPAVGGGARILNNGMVSQGGWDATWNASLAADTTALVATLRCDATSQTWTDAAAGNENRPIVCVTWYEAMAFCAWDGGFLPTEAESMYAGSGGSLQRAYPWSSPAASTYIDCTLANYGGTNWLTGHHGPGVCGRNSSLTSSWLIDEKNFARSSRSA